MGWFLTRSLTLRPRLGACAATSCMLWLVAWLRIWHLLGLARRRWLPPRDLFGAREAAVVAAEAAADASRAVASAAARVRRRVGRG